MKSSESLQLKEAKLYQFIWRWHGVAGLFVAPFILFMSLTGLPYLWQYEIEEMVHADLVNVQPAPQAGSPRLTYTEQVAAAEAAMGNQPASKIQISRDPLRSTRVDIETENGVESVYVSPYTGKVLGTVNDDERLASWTIRWHGGIPLNDPGSWAIELFACWSIVLFVTGLYLWWPRSQRWWWGILLPRLRSGKKIFWIDVHKVTGAWISLFAIGFLATGLPWTAFWGTQILNRVQHALGHDDMNGSFWSSQHESTPEFPDQPQVTWDVIADQVLAWPGEISRFEIMAPWGSTGTYRARHMAAKSTDKVNAHYHIYTGKQIGLLTWQDKAWSQKMVSFGINVHEGFWWGRFNQIGNTLAAFLLSMVAISGVIIWWRRRPQKTQRKSYPIPSGLSWPVPVLTGVAACLMPFFGISLLIILGIQKLRQRLI